MRAQMHCAARISATRNAMLCVALLALTNCARDEQPTAKPSLATLEPGAPDPMAPEPDAPEPYARGRWRLAAPSTLETAVLWVSHIQIRHAELDASAVAFSMMPWYTGTPAAERSRAEALALARQVAAQARAEPSSFAELARRYSEDVTSRERGGELGPLTAFQLSFPPEVLDALAALAQDEVSGVVESDAGFHVFYKHSPPPAGHVSGAHLVIGYEGADWMLALAGRRANRTRAAALELAQSVYRELNQDPARFDELVARYSEHPDAARQGDFGSWSTREPSVASREIAMLQALEVGEIAPPIDTPAGISIVRRTPERPRARYAAEVIRLGFDPRVSADDPSSKASVLEEARALRAKLREDPSRFEDLQARYCCVGARQWLEGQDEPGRLTEAVASLAPGEIAAEPVEHRSEYLIPRRLDAARVPPPSITLEVPAPPHMDVLDLMRRSAASDGFVKAHLDAVAERLTPELHLRTEQRAAIDRLSSELDATHEPNERVELYQQLTLRLRDMLGESGSARYEEAIYDHFEALYLRPNVPAPTNADEPPPE